MNDVLVQEIRQIVALISQRRMADALPRVQRLIATYPAEPEAWRFYAQVAASNAAIDQAILGYRRAIALKPADIDLHIELAQTAMAGNRRRAALETAHAIAALKPAKPEQLNMLGAIFTFCEEAAAALPLFEAASAARPDDARLLYDLAACQRMNGQLDEAERSVERVIQTAPDDVRAYLMRADLRRQTKERNHVADLERAVTEKRGGDGGEAMLCYALAKELEDLGEHARSFAYLSRAAGKQNATERYRIDDEVAMLKRLAERHDAKSLESAKAGHPSSEPIFVIGLPRSGTTLVDRILSSHPAVSSIGESHAFGVAVQRLLQARTRRPPTKLEIVDRGLELDPFELGQAYIEETRPQTGNTPRFVDKMLINYLYAGLIKRALPNAKIIALRRNPLDNCYAMHKSLLTGQFGFTSNLRDLARYYAACARLMDHWRDTLGPSYRELRYEDLVAEPEPAIRDLVGLAGLEWNDRCLDFHRTSTPVTSASASQVRQPIYTSSVGKWRAYRDELRELIEGLEAEGISAE